MDKKSTEKSIIDGISELIKLHLINAAYQQYSPDGDPDKSDSTIADAKEKAAKLRKVREEFENITTGILLDF